MRRLLLIVITFLIFGATFDAAGQAQKKKKKAPAPVAGQDDPKHDPKNAVANLDVHPELQATLFASELNGITNPTNLDIDNRGRVWICDVKNYRGNNGSRPEGDRILILEDTDGDGVCDKVTTFYQGRDVDSAMGICVLGNKVIVSASPNVFVFTKDDNDKVLKKEVLFAKTGIPQHDHSAHSFVFGPDGRLYWNFGNTGHSVNDKDGKPIVDLAGNAVNDSGKPYRQGMVFRMDTPWLKNRARQQAADQQAESWPDATKGPGAGVNFETLAWNFRNNYEVCVDSFGSMWQSDNDDDGNRGVRINYVMEYGNFGYVDEMTGAGWQAKRTNMEKEIPERHWHLNDPGVVPTLLLTGAGSPCGMTIYEGTLLPKIFHGQMIHADAGPSVVRSYPVVKDGAGYKVTQTVNILDGAKKNNWFRPADVCVAPDGSLFVTDWYDPGVGGHAQRDLDRGRIFRVTPKFSPGSQSTFSPGSQNRGGQDAISYKIPTHDFSTADGAVEALKNPNLATRYLAWTALHDIGAKAEPALLKAWKSEDTRLRARALWLLGRIDGRGPHYVDLAIRDRDSEVQIVGIRLARQSKMDVLNIKAIRDEANFPPPFKFTPAHRREQAIALRGYNDKTRAARQWQALAGLDYDGKDRWYLEALGIGADGNWDLCMRDYFMFLNSVDADDPVMRNLIWRSRATGTPNWLAREIINEEKRGRSENISRLFRAFDFQKDTDIKNAALLKLAFDKHADPSRQAYVSAEAIMRLKGFDITKKPEHTAALDKLLDSTKDTSAFVEVVGKFSVSNRYPELLAMAQKHAGAQLGVDAMRTLLDRDSDIVRGGLASKDVQVALATVQAMANAAHTSSPPLLVPIVSNPKQDLELRRQATRALGKTKNGAQRLIQLAEEKKLDKSLEFAAGSVLHSAQWKDVKEKAAVLFPLPAGKDNTPLPLISDLVKKGGNAGAGKTLFFSKEATCANCHIVNGEGKQVGPDLSEIGKKLSKEALYESILYPSAGISHNYETHILETKKGDVVQGILISQTPQEVVLKDKDALQRTFKASDIESMVKSPISLMPADLHKNLTTEELTDVVEYLLTLREARKK